MVFAGSDYWTAGASRRYFNKSKPNKQTWYDTFLYDIFWLAEKILKAMKLNGAFWRFLRFMVDYFGDSHTIWTFYMYLTVDDIRQYLCFTFVDIRHFLSKTFDDIRHYICVTFGDIRHYSFLTFYDISHFLFITFDDVIPTLFLDNDDIVVTSNKCTKSPNQLAGVYI